MGIRSGGTLLAAVTAAFVIAPGWPASAQFGLPGLGGTQPTGQGATAKSSKSNTSDRMGGGGGKGSASRATTVKSSKSNTSDRMGGGGGKGVATRKGNLNSSRSN